MTTPQQRNLISSAGFIGLVAAMKEPAETYVKCNQVRLRASRSRSRTSIAYVTPPNSFRDHAMLTRTPINPQALQLGLGAWGVIAAQFVLIPDRFMDDMFDQPRPTNHARLVCRVAGTGIFTAIAALMELKNTGNVKKACKIFAVGNTAALFLGPQTAERELKGHCTKKHIIPHLALGLNGLALAATLL